MHYEVEQKFPIDDPARVEQRLLALGAKFVEQCEQADQYFAHPARDFAQTDEALRIRSIGKKNFVTYKGPKLDQTTKTRREIELPLAPGSGQAHDFAEMLVALGFRPVAVVRKHRRTFELTWQSQAVEAALDNVALDDVAKVGQFVELEISADERTLDAARQALAELAKSLGLGTSERRSYLELLLEGTG